MPFVLQYLLKLSLTLGVLYMFYYAVLKNLTFWVWNRYYLLGYSIIAWIIPFVNITPWIREEPGGDDALLYQVILTSRLSHMPAATGSTGFPVPVYTGVIVLMAAGSVVMVIRFLYQLLSIWSIRRKATLIKADKISLYDVPGKISPFSFAQSIYINTNMHSEQDLQKIIEHEFVHVKQRHTVDLMVAELLCIVNWYNPFAWLIKKAIRQNLEFIADNSVLQTGVDAREYQYLLLKVTGLQPYSISNNFSISSLKKRILMMNKIRSAKVQLVKFLFVVPLVAVMLLAFRSRQEQQRQAQLSSASFNSSFAAADTVPPPPPPPPAKGKNGKPPVAFPPPKVEVVRFAPPSAQRKDVVSNKVTVTLKNGKKEVYDLQNLKERWEYERKYREQSPRIPPAPSLPFPAVKADSSISVRITSEVSIPETRTAEVTIVKTQPAEVSVYKNQPAEVVVQGYATPGKKKDLTEITVDGHPAPAGNAGQKSLMVIGHAKNSKRSEDPLYLKDGVIVENGNMGYTDPSDISSINLLKGEKATKLFGDKGVNGVVMFTTKSNAVLSKPKEEDKNRPGDVNFKLPPNFKGLMVVDGKEVPSSQLEHMDGANIKSISLLKDQSAVSLYGEKGREGVILITTKK